MRDVSVGTPYVSVKDHGAKGDNSTNDQAAFTAAGTSAPVFVPAGTYVLTSYPAGWYYGQGVLKVGTELVYLDKSSPQRVDTQLQGDGRRVNTLVGQQAGAVLLSDASSGANAVFGDRALMSSTSSSRNTAIGSGAMRYSDSTNMSKNVAVGTDACYASVWNDSNTYMGSNAGKWCGDNAPVAHGHDWTIDATVGGLIDRYPNLRTDVIGTQAAPANLPTSEADHQENVGVGRNALLHAVKAVENVAVGYNALAHGYNIYRSVAVGQGALRDGMVANDSVAVGNCSQQQNQTGVQNTSVGAGALMYNVHSRYNVAIGFEAMKNFPGGSAAPGTGMTAPGELNRRNTAVGVWAMADAVSGMYNVAMGSSCLRAVNSSWNTAIGTGALAATTTGGANTAIGNAAGEINTTGTENVFIGADAGKVNTTGNFNVAVGTGSLRANAGANHNNVAVGHYALASSASGANNTAIGYQAGRFTVNAVTAATPTATGMTGFSNTTSLGANSGCTASNQVQLGSSITNTYHGGAAVAARSDIRDKADVRDTVLGLEFINKIRPVDYRWDHRDEYAEDLPDGTRVFRKPDGSKKRKRFHHGVIAQEVREVIEETGEDFGGFQDHTIAGGADVLTIGYTEFIAPLIKAVQELSAQVEELKKQVKEKK